MFNVKNKLNSFLLYTLRYNKKLTTMYSYKRTSENTASPIHEKFKNYQKYFTSSDSLELSESNKSPITQVYRQRHISNKDQRFASIALDEAAKSTLLMQHGCIAVLSGKVIAKGCNNIRSHSKDGLLHYQKCCSAHAEICVLHKLCITELPAKIVQKIVLYIVRRSRSGDMVESAPCFHCTIRMKKLNIKAIVFSNSEGELEKRKMNEYDSNKLTYGAKRVIDPSFYIR